MVRPARRMLSAISLGVFCRCAPSTSAIMRSRKVAPCAAVILTLIQSEITCVPPVTAERSPPLSRMTGADSPVMELSLTEATPSMTSPSLGMRSPASTSTTSPGLSEVPGTCSHSRPPPVSSFAMVSVLVLRRLAACALPRPSATASAKFAKSTVNHSQRLIWKAKPRLPPPVTRSLRKSSVVSAATISTTNITGLRQSVAGLSLASDSRMAGTRILRSASLAIGIRWRVWTRSMEGLPGSVERAGLHREMLDDGAERQRREEDEPTRDQDHADEEPDEKPAIGRERACRGGDDLLRNERARDRQHGHDHEEAADEHRKAERGIVEERIGAQAREGAAIVAGGRDEGVENLAEAMRPGIGGARESGGNDRRNGAEAQHRERQDQDGEHRHLDLLRLNLLAEIFGRAADHQPRDEHGEDGEDQHAIEPRADTAEDDLAEHDVDHRHHAGERHQTVMHVVDRAARGVGGDGREERGLGDAEAHLLPFHVAAGLDRALRAVDAERGEGRIARRLRPIDRRGAGEEEQPHHREDRPALTLIADHPAEHVGKRRADREDQQHLHEVGE